MLDFKIIISSKNLQVKLSENTMKFLCKKVIEIFKNESSLLKLKAPMKIIGNLYGHYGELL